MPEKLAPALDAALAYARLGYPIFPCKPWPDKSPLTRNGFKDASRYPAQIEAWWSRRPDAIIGMPTGRASGINILDIDIKGPLAYGFDSLDALGHPALPDTPLAHTPSGGVHLYFRADKEIRNSAGKLGPGLDTRGDGGYIILPSAGSGYAWDAHWNLDNVELAPTPDWLIPAALEGTRVGKPVEPANGLSPYAEAALHSACRNIVRAPNGEQEKTMGAEAYSIGRLAGAAAIPQDFALRMLLLAGSQIPDYDPRSQWTAPQIERRITSSFNDGMRKPRPVPLRGRHHG
jgi:hypothetical protein